MRAVLVQGFEEVARISLQLDEPPTHWAVWRGCQNLLATWRTSNTSSCISDMMNLQHINLSNCECLEKLLEFFVTWWTFNTSKDMGASPLVWRGCQNPWVIWPPTHRHRKSNGDAASVHWWLEKPHIWTHGNSVTLTKVTHMGLSECKSVFRVC